MFGLSKSSSLLICYIHLHLITSFRVCRQVSIVFCLHVADAAAAAVATLSGGPGFCIRYAGRAGLQSSFTYTSSSKDPGIVSSSSDCCFLSPAVDDVDFDEVDKGGTTAADDAEDDDDVVSI